MTMVGTSTATARRSRLPSTPGAAAAVSHTATAEGLATTGRWEQAHEHLRTAVRLLNGQPGVDELDRPGREHAEAREQGRRDRLTAIYSRRYLDERLVALLGDPADIGAAGIAVALLDVDRVTQVNDVYGHHFGDLVLRRLVAVIDAGLPGDALCARYGGEEFVIVLRGHDRDAAVRVCEAVRERVDHHPWDELAPGLRVTVSIGVAPGFGPVIGRNGLVATADALLYAAKRAGRNTVAFHDSHSGLVRLAGPLASRRSVP